MSLCAALWLILNLWTLKTISKDLKKRMTMTVMMAMMKIWMALHWFSHKMTQVKNKILWFNRRINRLSNILKKMKMINNKTFTIKSKCRKTMRVASKFATKWMITCLIVKTSLIISNKLHFRIRVSVNHSRQGGGYHGDKERSFITIIMGHWLSIQWAISTIETIGSIITIFR